VHTLASQLLPVLAAEKSKVPYYIAGGALVAWALIVSILLGLRKPDFPGSIGGERAVITITIVLVLAATSTAVITSGETESASASGTTTTTASPGGTSAPAPATSAPTASTPAAPPPGKSPKATTGTPAPPSSPAAATTLKLAANPAGQLAYEPKQLNAKAGKVTIDFANASPIEHDVAVAQGSSIVGQTPVFSGGAKTLSLNLKPGTYKFFCTVPGHRQAGMEGTLTVS
jgi:plastocyanin